MPEMYSGKKLEMRGIVLFKNQCSSTTINKERFVFRELK